MALGDLDGDGDLDMVLADYGQASRALLNDGSGVFTEASPLLGVTDAAGVALGDVDGDGDLDVSFANGAGASNTIWLNDGPEDYDAIAAVRRQLPDDLQPAPVRHRRRRTRRRLRPVPDRAAPGTFVINGQALGTVDSESAAVGDLDGDGDLDITYANNGRRAEHDLVQRRNRQLRRLGTGTRDLRQRRRRGR